MESSDLRVDGIVETCINVAEINRAREFYQSLFNFEAMVSDERFCALRAGPDVLLLFTHGGSNEPSVIRGGVIPPHETRGAGHLAFAISSDALETWRTRLRERGIEIESEVQEEYCESLHQATCLHARPEIHRNSMTAKRTRWRQHI